MYAVIETGGKQYQVKEGDIVFIEKLEAEGEITFDKVIMVGKDDGVKVGAPYVDGASVKATLLKNGKSKKITVFTYKPKKSSKRKMGHRQPYSQVRMKQSTHNLRIVFARREGRIYGFVVTGHAGYGEEGEISSAPL